MPNKVLRFFFILLWFLPAVMTFFQLDSYSVTTVVVIFLFNLSYYLYNPRFAFTKKFINIFIIVVCGILIHSVATILYFNLSFDLIRNILSIPFVCIMLVGAYNFSKVILATDGKSITKLLHSFFYFYLGFVALSFVIPTFIYSKPIFPYPEPSHMALFFGPIVGYLVIYSKTEKKRFYFLFAGIVVALIVKNMTLLVTMVILAVFVYHIYVVPILLIGGAGIYFFADIEYFLSRLDFKNMQSTNNLSTLVYAKGFQLMEEGLRMSDGLGIGFQQLGFVDVRTEIGDYLIKVLDGLELNSRDGGFTAAKLVAEFGIVGILVIATYLYYLVKQWFCFKKLSLNSISAQDALFYASIITIFSEIFFRGIGYFTATMFLFFSVLFMRSLMKNKLKNIK